MFRRRQTRNSPYLIPFGRGKQWQQERLEELKHRGLTIELTAIETIEDGVVIEAGMLGYGTEYWLMDTKREKFDFSVVHHMALEEQGEIKRRFPVIESARLICKDGMPLSLKNSTLLRERGIKPLRLITRF